MSTEPFYIAVVGVAWGSVLYVGRDLDIAACRLVPHTAFARGRSPEEAIQQARQIAAYSRTLDERARTRLAAVAGRRSQQTRRNEMGPFAS